MNAESDTSTPRCLDDLYVQALAGDEQAVEAMLASLRVRFLAIAKRRVQQESLEDVVQDALRIVYTKYRQQRPARGILIWGFAILRNVIGNYYQVKQRRAERETAWEDLTTLPAAARLEPPFPATGEKEDGGLQDAQEMIAQAIALLARQYPRCGRFFQSILSSLEQGDRPREISQRAWELVRRQEPELSRSSFYVALHRCRSLLRQIVIQERERRRHE